MSKPNIIAMGGYSDISMTHYIDIETANNDNDEDTKVFRAICDCGWQAAWRDEFWMADDDGWYHADYPNGE